MKVRCLLIGVIVLFIAGVLTASSYAKLDPKTCVGMWLFDEGKDDIVKDSSGNKNDGTLKRKPEWVAGKFGTALQFNSAKLNYVIAPIPYSNSITVGMWAKYYKSLPSTPADDPGLFHAQATAEDESGTKIIGIWVNGSTKKLWGRVIQADKTALSFPQNKELSVDTWYYITLTADENSKKIKQWVDGEAVAEMNYSGKIDNFLVVFYSLIGDHFLYQPDMVGYSQCHHWASMYSSCPKRPMIPTKIVVCHTKPALTGMILMFF